MRRMGWSETQGKVASRVYRAVTDALTPFLFIHVGFVRRLRGLEHRTRWTERFGVPSFHRRPDGPLLWFHAVSLGEGMAALPVINHCVQHYPHFNVLMTTTTTSTFNVIKDQLPDRVVIYQYAPLDVSTAVEAFLDFRSPDATILIENELWPNLILSASEKGIPLALLNARMSLRSFRLWSQQLVKPLVSLMLSKFSLIIPLGTDEAIRFQLLGAPPAVINFAGDLKYVVDVRVPTQDINMEDLGSHFASRPVWMASSTHKGEEAVMSWIHKELAQTHPGLLTIMVPRHPQRGKEIAKALQEEGMNVKLRSQQKFISSSTEIYVVDTLGELKRLYRSTPIAVVGGSFFSGGSGHNISEAAAARCAVLTGPHVGHFSQMIREMQRLDPLSVQQVSTKFELLDSLRELFSKAEALEARRMAAETTVSRLSRMVVQNIWNFIDIHVLRKGYS